MRVRDFSAPFHATWELSVNFCQLSMQPGELPSTFRAARRPSVKLSELSVQRETFRSSVRSSVKFRQISTLPGDLQSSCKISVQPGELPSTYVNFLFGLELSVHFLELFVSPGHILSTSINIPCRWENFFQFPSTFRAARRLSVNICQFFMRVRDLPSTFRAPWRLSVNFHQLSLQI